MKSGSDYLVFIDDDEWVEPDWLVNLYGYCKANGGNIIVSGKVISDLPRDISDEIKGLFNKKIDRQDVNFSRVLRTMFLSHRWSLRVILCALISVVL